MREVSDDVPTFIEVHRGVGRINGRTGAAPDAVRVDLDHVAGRIGVHLQGVEDARDAGRIASAKGEIVIAEHLEEAAVEGVLEQAGDAVVGRRDVGGDVVPSFSDVHIEGHLAAVGVEHQRIGKRTVFAEAIGRETGIHGAGAALVLVEEQEVDHLAVIGEVDAHVDVRRTFEFDDLAFTAEFSIHEGTHCVIHGSIFTVHGHQRQHGGHARVGGRLTPGGGTGVFAGTVIVRGVGIVVEGFLVRTTSDFVLVADEVAVGIV